MDLGRGRPCDSIYSSAGVMEGIGCPEYNWALVLSVTRFRMFLSTSDMTHNLKQLQVIESQRNAIRTGLVYELLDAQDTVLCSYSAQRNGERDEVFQALGNFE